MKSFIKGQASFFCVAMVLLAGFFAGCATVPNGQDLETGEEDPFEPATNETIGFVVSVDPEEEIAVVEVRSSRTRAAPSMVARNDAMVETARLEPTRFQSGRTLGARIVSGLPNVGDEVIAIETRD